MNTQRFSARQRGFSLIEVLVAVAILSFGMLGIAAMQISGLRANQGSYFRSQAALIASDMAERMYSNRTGTQTTLYDGLNAATGTACTPVPKKCSVDSQSTTAASIDPPCSVAQTATYDRFIVYCGLPVTSETARQGGVRDLLPGGTIGVTCLPVAPAVCGTGTRRQITVTWSERVEQAGGTSAPINQTLQLTVEP